MPVPITQLLYLCNVCAARLLQSCGELMAIFFPWYPERLTALGIMEAQLRALLKNFCTILRLYFKAFRGPYEQDTER